MHDPERRTDTRLRLAYPIRLRLEGTAAPACGGERTVTSDVSARGAYFATRDAAGLRAGDECALVITVPHRLAGSDEEIVLDLDARARVVRIERSHRPRLFGEDAPALAGVAVRFEQPLLVRTSRV